MGQEINLDLRFPLKGLHEGTAVHNQPKLTTASALNVRGFNPRSGRAQGASRSGTSKFLDSQIAAAPIQTINHIVAGNAGDTLTETFNSTDTWTAPAGVTNVVVECWGGGGGGGSNAPGAGGGGGAYSKKNVTVTPSSSYTVTVGAGGTAGSAGGDSWFSTTGTVLAKGGGGGGVTAGSGGAAASGVGDTKYDGGDGGNRDAVNGNGGGGGSSAGTAAAGDDGDAGSAGGAGAGGTAPTGGGDGGAGSEDTSDATAGSAPGGAGGGDSADLGSDGGAGAAGRVRLTYASTTFSTRTTTRVVAAGGNIGTFTSASYSEATNGASALVSAPFSVRSVTAFGQVWFVDGTQYKVYDPETDTVSTWTASNGTLPEDSAGRRARLIQLWRGRAVLSGIVGDAQNWFMSEAGDFLEWGYNPTPSTVIQPVAGNNSDLGLVGDIVTSLVPWSREVFVFGCDHSLWMMNGDPAQGGTINEVTDITGMGWGQSWTLDPQGVLYFWSTQGGVWRWEPGGIPISISDDRLKERFNAINLLTHRVHLIWDSIEQGLHVFITPLSAAATTHYWWDSRLDAWWADQFASTDHNPICAHVIDSDNPTDRVLLLGCQDGYIRQKDQDAKDDDGTAISSNVKLGPLRSKKSFTEIMLRELQAVLDKNSDGVNYRVFAGRSPDQALAAATPRFKADTAATQWTAGRNRSERRRARGEALFLELYENTANKAWAMESIEGRAMEIGGAGQRAF